ncbi:MAG TPA: SMP-30/gluconolactonase/LRE family protein [Acetobacteraceae bacterium]|nr:SMP-30/gluconolactonase/LRE family protein [Acetobacteraceae bacterium]
MSGLRRVGATTDVLGEGPIWDTEEQALYWVDIRSRLIRRMDGRTGDVQSWLVPDLVSCLALRSGGPGLVLAMRTGIAFWTPEAGVTSMVPHGGGEDMRFNDGRCDPQGRFWAGTMHDVERSPVGRLFRYDGTLSPVLDGIGIPNSLCWSPDGRRMYFADSQSHAIQAYDFDPASGTVGQGRIFARVEPPAVPDGATVDRDGYVWCANYGGWKVVRYAPDGSIDRVVDLPVQQPTSCAFGGPELRTLFITTATQRLSEAELRDQPLAGALLALDDAGVGRPEPRFAG